MKLFDINVLIYAHREDTPDHEAYRGYVEKIVNSSKAFGFFDMVTSGFLRIVTHPKIFNPPIPFNIASTFIDEIRKSPNSIKISTGDRHWEFLCLYVIKPNQRET